MLFIVIQIGILSAVLGISDGAAGKNGAYGKILAGGNLLMIIVFIKTLQNSILFL